jgi:hypothetical protein
MAPATPKAATKPTATKTKATALTCPECGKTFTRPAALGAHRKMTHGVAGTSANATANRKRAATRKRRTATSPQPGRTTAGTPNSQSSVDRDALLRALFPNGIPPRQDVIGEINDWLDQAERLARRR